MKSLDDIEIVLRQARSPFICACHRGAASNQRVVAVFGSRPGCILSRLDRIAI